MIERTARKSCFVGVFALVAWIALSSAYADTLGERKGRMLSELEPYHEGMNPTIHTSNKGAGNVVGNYNTTLIGHWANGPCFAVAVVDNIAYFGNGDYLQIVDISNPVHPLEVGKALMPSVVMGVAVSGSFAYVADYAGGLRIIDISNPTNPMQTGFFDTGGYAYGVAVSGNYAYVADYTVGLRIIDISNPGSPTEVGFFDTGGIALDVVFSGSYVYLADREDGLYIIRNDLLTAINDNPVATAKTFVLYQNYPNPFNPQTTIGYQLPKATHVVLKIYNIFGQEVASLVNGWQPAGANAVKWDGRDQSGKEVGSGIYIYRLQTGEFSQSRKLSFVR